MSTKCPYCGSNNTETTKFIPNRSNEKKIANGLGVVGIGLLGAFVGGPIGAIAGGAIGKYFAQNLAGNALDKSGEQVFHCKECGKEWSKFVYYKDEED